MNRLQLPRMMRNPVHGSCFAFTHVSVDPMDRADILKECTVLIVDGVITAVGPTNGVPLDEISSIRHLLGVMVRGVWWSAP